MSHIAARVIQAVMMTLIAIDWWRDIRCAQDASMLLLIKSHYVQNTE